MGDVMTWTPGIGVAAMLLSQMLAGASPVISVQDVTVGNNLQTTAKITLDQQAPFSGLQVIVRVEDPTKALLSKRQDRAGKESIFLDINPGARESEEFWIQGLSDSGEVAYTAAAEGLDPRTGKITLSPSGIIMFGPLRAPKFPTTPRGAPSRITIQSARLDSAFRVVEQQPVAGGKSVKIEILNSNEQAGSLASSHVAIQSGLAATVVDFRPLQVGEAKLSITPPDGFVTPAEFAEVTAMVTLPGIGVTDQVMIGQNLQISGVVGLGQAPPEEGVDVTLTSEDPDRLLLSPNAKDAGAPSIKVRIPPDSPNARFYLQGLAASGTATYTASAPGYRARTGTVVLAPSGVVITPRPYGPPDEAELFRKQGESDRGFVSSLGKSDTMALVVWTAQLDPESHRSADITVQELRAGVKVEVRLASSDPMVGGVDPVVTIEGATDHAVTKFQPRRPGKTLISALTPEGFTQSANSTSVTAIVKE